MKKIIFTLAVAFMMSPLSASTAEIEVVSWKCHEIASAGADAVEGGHSEKWEVYDAVYQECLEQDEQEELKPAGSGQ